MDAIQSPKENVNITLTFMKIAVALATGVLIILLPRPDNLTPEPVFDSRGFMKSQDTCQ